MTAEPCTHCGKTETGPYGTDIILHCSACGHPSCSSCGAVDIDWNDRAVIICEGACPDKHHEECECDECFPVCTFTGCSQELNHEGQHTVRGRSLLDA